MDGLTPFGATAVALMLLFYTLEPRSAHFALAFAGACLASSVYGFLQGAWPFGVVEAIWSLVALRCWWARRTASRRTTADASGARPEGIDPQAHVKLQARAGVSVWLDWIDEPLRQPAAAAGDGGPSTLEGAQAAQTPTPTLRTAVPPTLARAHPCVT